MKELIQIISTYGTAVFGKTEWLVFWTAIKIILIIFPIFIFVAYLVLWERKLIGWMHIRIGPNRVGPFGLLQPIADVLKLLLKEVILPTKANKILYILGPLMVISSALSAWAVIPFSPNIVLSDIDLGLLYVMAITSIGVYGIILSGWSSNSKYAFLGAMRAGAQMISYEIPMGLALVAVLIISGTLNLTDIINSQKGYCSKIGLNFLSWNWLPLLPMFLIYFISGVAELNRHPFDIVEGESEIVAGHMIEYSGMSFAMFFLAEYANMILIATLISIMFFGGWEPILSWSIFSSEIPCFVWLFLKVLFFLSCFIWLRASFPRYRYDQLMRLSWKIFIPISLIWILFISAWKLSYLSIWR